MKPSLALLPIIAFIALAVGARAQGKIDLCGAVKVAEIARITGVKLDQAKPDPSPSTASCAYSSSDPKTYGMPTIAVQVFLNNPNTPAAERSVLKMKNVQPVAGVGLRAFWYTIMPGMNQLAVIVKQDAWMAVNVYSDTIAGGNPKGAALEIAKLVLARLKL
jgi:hypothetical protein